MLKIEKSQFLKNSWSKRSKILCAGMNRMIAQPLKASAEIGNKTANIHCVSRKSIPPNHQQ